jgi:predicted 3-demethylubiquinone-9 3-methyltransferase (glyoxalase superfamily)
MKLRIKGATLRLRLTQGEIRALQEQGQVEEQVPFAPNVSLIYRLRKNAAARQIGASYSGNVVQIEVPAAAADAWCVSQQVTLAHVQSVGSDALSITLEKDFACLAPRAGEDESDNFPHPEAQGDETC